ncbi:Uncharacterized protein GBIM_18421 [Gryllus bimaculatus]|nr:Uncharacterized protein GBIM_18421 [Gryllus bimaculatus]
MGKNLHNDQGYVSFIELTVLAVSVVKQLGDPYSMPGRIWKKPVTLFLFVIFVQNCDIQDHLWKVSSSLQQVFGILCVSDFLKRIVNLSKNPVSDSVFLEKLKLLDYGSGMAQNFFYGYLRIILPNTGDEGKGIIERIDDFISQQRLSEDSFPVKKLFILIPSSSYLPNDLKDCSFDWMKSAGTLEKKIRDRAGVISRPYKNSVYRIKNPDDDNDKGIYVVAEGATPCKTLHEVVQYSGERQEFYKEHQKEIIFSFFETLRETLREDRDCRGLCEFVYYDGTDEFGLGNINTDEFGLNNVNVGRLLLQRIEEIQATEEFLRGVRDRNI